MIWVIIKEAAADNVAASFFLLSFILLQKGKSVRRLRIWYEKFNNPDKATN